MKSERIRFKNREGIELDARLELPEDEKPLAYAVFAHCFTCTKNSLAATRIARELGRQRIAVLRFDFTGLGESEGDFAATGFSSNLADLIAAAAWLEQHHDAPQILIGHSLGGAAVLQAAGRIPSVRAVATLAAPCDPAHVLRLLGDSAAEIERRGKAQIEIGGRPITLGKEFLDDLRGPDPREIIAGLDAALLVMHSPLDRVVDISNAAAIYQAARHPKSFISLDPADHLLSRKEDSRYAADMIAVWARRYLETAVETPRFAEVIDNRVTVRTPAGAFRSDMFVNGHALVADEPIAYGGTGRGPSPYDYLQAALGACTGMTLQMYAGRKKWPLESVVVRLTHEKIHERDCENCEDPKRKIDHFDRELELTGDLSAEQRARLLEIAEKCPVHKTLLGEASIDTSLREGGG